MINIEKNRKKVKSKCHKVLGRTVVWLIYSNFYAENVRPSLVGIFKLNTLFDYASKYRNSSVLKEAIVCNFSSLSSGLP
jgi:hypothetical protein